MRRFIMKKPSTSLRVNRYRYPKMQVDATKPIIEMVEPIVEVEEVIEDLDFDELEPISDVVKEEVKSTPKKRKKGSKKAKNSLNEENNLLTENISNVMDTRDKITLAASILDSMEAQPEVKTLRREKGLIERTESSKIILTEDNKELLHD